MFVADAPGLDFLNSIATPLDEAVDWIADGVGLADWLGQAGLVPSSDLTALMARAAPGELDRVAGQARDLRDWFRGFVQAHAGRPLGADAIAALEPLNRLLERDEAYVQMVAAPAIGHDHDGPAHRDEGLTLVKRRRWRSPESLLLPIGEALARLVCEDDFTQVKACEGHGCTLMFVDRTRAHSRRWCSMAVCGNRAKVTAHRSRRKG